MNITIKKGTASGDVSIPSSKSVAHRLLINAALTDGETVINGLSLNEDIDATVDCLRTLGAKIDYSHGRCTVHGMNGRGETPRRLYCRESGSTLRFMIPLCLDSVKTELYGSPRLIERPHSVYSEICKKKRLFMAVGRRKNHRLRRLEGREIRGSRQHKQSVYNGSDACASDP